MSDVVIRPATAADTAALIALWQEFDDYHLAAQPDLLVAAAPAAWRPPVLATIADPDHRLLVAEHDGALIGYVHAVRQVSAVPLAPTLKVNVRKLAVSAAHRRGGVGQQLMRAVADWARASGASEIWLGVWDFNAAALAFYAGLGFAPWHHRLRLPLADQP